MSSNPYSITILGTDYIFSTKYKFGLGNFLRTLGRKSHGYSKSNVETRNLNSIVFTADMCTCVLSTPDPTTFHFPLESRIIQRSELGDAVPGENLRRPVDKVLLVEVESQGQGPHEPETQFLGLESQFGQVGPQIRNRLVRKSGQFSLDTRHLPRLSHFMVCLQILLLSTLRNSKFK